MKKIWLGVLATIMIMTFVSCGGSRNGEKYITEGKIAMTNEEYEKAKKFFKLGLEEESGNVEYLELLKIAENFFKLEEMNEKLEFTELENSVAEIKDLEALKGYKEEFDELVEKTKNNKKEFEKIKVYIDKVDKFKEEGELDKAKSLASEELKKVDNNEKIKDLFNKRIEEIEKIIVNAGNKVKELDKLEKEVKYKGVMATNEGGYDRLEKLKGKRMLHFMQDQESSAKDYMYDLKTGDIYNFNQGDIYHINTGKKVFDGIKYERDLEAKRRAEEDRKMLETKKASEELFYGLEHIEKNKHGVQTEALVMDFSASEFDISIVYSTWHLQRGDGENGENIEAQDVTQEMFDESRILARGDSFNGTIEYKGANLWSGDISNGGEKYKCEIRKISKGKYEITMKGNKKIFTTKR